MMTDKERIDAVIKSYRELAALQAQQRQTQALMIRACVARLKSHDVRKRAEAIKGLSDLAEMLEREA